jgi:hypothetical protein
VDAQFLHLVEMLLMQLGFCCHWTPDKKILHIFCRLSLNKITAVCIQHQLPMRSLQPLCRRVPHSLLLKSVVFN